MHYPDFICCIITDGNNSITTAQHFSFAECQRIPDFYSMCQQEKFCMRAQLFYEPPNRQKVDMAQYYQVRFKTLQYHFFNKPEFINSITPEVFCRKVEIIKCILLLIVHAAY